MKKHYILICVLAILSSVKAQTINFADPDFKALLVGADATTNPVAKDLGGNYFAVDANSDGEIQESEALQVSYLNASNSATGNFDGIAFFDNLTELDCTNSNESGSVLLDLTGMTTVKKLTCRNNELPLGIDSFNNLESLDLYFCDISGTLDLTGLTFIRYLNVGRTNITGLNLTGLSTLEELNIERTQLTSLDVSTLINLKIFYCQYAPIESMDFSNLFNLESITCRNTSLASMNITGCNSLRDLFCNSNQLTALDVSGLTSLEQLRCNSGKISSLNLTGCTNLFLLGCANNPLVTLNAQNLPNLTTLFCNGAMLQTLDISGSDNIVNLECNDNELTTLDCNHLHNLDILYCENNLLESLYVKNGAIESTLSYGVSETLQYICVDSEQIENCQSNPPNSECVVDSTCEVLATTDFIATNGIVIYPNPAALSVNIAIDGELRLKSITVYNVLGQLVSDLPNANGVKGIDVSKLTPGNYFIRLKTESGEFNTRFVKI